MSRESSEMGKWQQNQIENMKKSKKDKTHGMKMIIGKRNRDYNNANGQMNQSEELSRITEQENSLELSMAQ